MNPVVLGFSGRIGSGKSTLAALVAEALQAPCVGFGDYVRRVAEYAGLNIHDRKALQLIGEALVKYPEEFCAKVIAQANYQPGHMLVIEGIRHKIIVDQLRRQVAPARLVLVFVKVSEERIEDSLQGEDADQHVSELVGHSTEREVLTILASMADIVVDNSRVRQPEEVVNDILQGLEKFTGAFQLPERILGDISKWVQHKKPEGDIRFDKDGVAWLDNTNIKAIEVIQDQTELGRSPDEILVQHPHLSRTQIRAALEYYNRHREEVDIEIEQRYKRTETMRQQATHKFTREELEERLKANQKGN